MLVVVAQRLKAVTRPTDSVARVGGDEFVVVVDEPDDPADRAAYVERLRAAVCSPMAVAGHPVTVGCSIGTASSAEERNWAALLGAADRRMFEDKAARRDAEGSAASG